MVNPLDFFGLIEKVLEILSKKIKDYSKKNEINTKLVSAINTELKEYKKTISNIDICTQNIIDYLDIIENNSNELIASQIFNESLSQIREYNKLIDNYISLVKAIKEVSKIEGFMGEIKQNNIFLYDFILQISNTLRSDEKIYISNEYMRFIKLYENNFYNKIDKQEVEKINKFMQKYLKIIRIQFRSTIIIMKNKREINPKYVSKEVISTFKQFGNNIKKIKIEASEENMLEFAPIKMLKSSIILNELKNLEGGILRKNQIERYNVKKNKKT
jgi:hypothetical protein